MARSGRLLDNPLNWSFKVGRLFAIDIRVHVTFVLCALVLVSMEVARARAAELPLIRAVLFGLGTEFILFFVVLVHEFGHCFGSRHVGGEAHEILLWPLGGLALVSPPHNARAHMITAVAGPMVNVIFCAIASAVLVLWVGSLAAVPWNPLSPSTIALTTSQFWVARFFFVSYILLLFNLMPLFPFDGGRVLQAWLWPRKGYVRSIEIATGIGMAGAIALGLLGLFTQQSWLLLMIAVFGYFTCWQMRRAVAEASAYGGGFGSDFGDAYTPYGTDDSDPPERKVGFLERRRLRRQASKDKREQEERKRHLQAVERVLRKISGSGMDALTPEERRILDEETQRQRLEDAES